MSNIKTYEEFNLSKIYKTLGLKKLEIRSICKEYDIKNYTINEDGTVDVNGSVHLNSCELTKIPLNFNKVSGSFRCDNNNLKSLEGCPKEVGGDFDCGRNEALNSLEGCPYKIGGRFYCNNCYLDSLIGGPKEVGESYDCSYNFLSSLEHSPIIINDVFDCSDNFIESFEHAPTRVGDNYTTDFICYNNPIYKIWNLFEDYSKIELFNDLDPVRDDKTIILDRLNEFLDMIGERPVDRVSEYICI